MEKLEIYEFQARDIENTLRMVSNVLESSKRETCIERNVMQSLERIRNVLSKDIDKTTKYV